MLFRSLTDDHKYPWRIDGSTGGIKWRDIAWLRNANAPTTLTVDGGQSVTSDAAFTILSTAGDFALIANGSAVALNGKPLITGNTAPVATFPP